MNILDFQRQFISHRVFSLNDVKKMIPEFQRIQLDRWEKGGYLTKIKQGFYAFSNQDKNELFLFLVANEIYSPSYISLEKALKFYGLIPEEIFQITSVSSKKTTNFKTPVGDFKYRNVKPSLFWGYKLIKINDRKVLVAEAEKAILDYLYLNPNLKTADDFIEMRINIDSFKEQVNIKKFQKYLKAFENKSLNKRVKTFLKTIEND
jgi:predicted transcriptional regulator of viral defense system